MAAGAEAPTSSEYIVHHLQHLQSVKQGFIIDMSVVNWDTIFWSIAMGMLTLFVLLKAASKASSGVPGRFQAAIARRRRSASPGVNPAATTASCITCSWKIGTPSVRCSTSLPAHRTTRCTT